MSDRDMSGDTDAYDEACNLLDALERLIGLAASVPEDRITESDHLSALRSAYNALYVFDAKARS